MCPVGGGGGGPLPALQGGVGRPGVGGGLGGRRTVGVGRDAVTVLGTEDDGLEYEQVERALQQLEAILVRHSGGQSTRVSGRLSTRPIRQGQSPRACAPR